MSKPLPTTGLLSVYDGQTCIGHLLARGRSGVEAFDVNDVSLGVFASQYEAITALIAAIRREAGAKEI
jgi:hypothetical protein